MMFNANPMQMIQAFNNFRNNFNGDPKAMVMNLIQSGKMNQAQLNQLQNMATAFQRMLNGMN